jgi:hypothetical protein
VAFTIVEAARHQRSRGCAGLLVQSVHYLPLEMESLGLLALAGEKNLRAVKTRNPL